MRPSAADGAHGVPMVSPVDEPEARVEPDEVATPSPERPAHRLVVHGLIVLAAVVLLITSANTWVKRQMLDTDQWVDTAEELLADEDIRAALSQYVVDQLYTSVDVAAQLEERLPDDLDGLAAPIAAGLRDPATKAVDRILATQQAQDVWSRANRRAHETLMNILNDETRPGVSTTGGVVTIELRELVVRLADTLGLPDAVVDRIPEDVGTITVVDSDELESAQRAVDVVQWASIVLFVLILALFGAAIFLARGWRRVAVRNVGLAVLVVSLVLLLAQRLGRRYVLDNYVAVDDNRPVVSEAWFIATQLLRDLAWGGVALGIVIAVAAVLVGPARGAVALRRRATPLFATNPGMVWGVAAAVVLLGVVWTPFDLFATWLGVLMVALVLVAALAAFQRTCLREATASR